MKAFTKAQAAFNEEKFDEAARLLEKAYLIEPKPELLYPWAQAERMQGNCKVAVDLYEQFLDSGAKGQFADAAKQNIERCREQMGAVEEPPVEEEVVEEPTDEEKPPPKRKTTKQTQRDDEPRKWYADPTGGVLFAVGIVGVGVGAGLLGVASSKAKNVGDAPTNEEYEGERKSATTLRNAGAAVLAVGGALLIGAVIRYAVVARKGKKKSTALRFDGVTFRF